MLPDDIGVLAITDVPGITEGDNSGHDAFGNAAFMADVLEDDENSRESSEDAVDNGQASSPAASPSEASADSDTGVVLSLIHI